MRYAIEFRPSSRKELTNLPQRDQVRVARTIDTLADNPRPQGTKKLEGANELYRLRVGDYRVIYQIQDAVLVVLVVRIGHRRDVYRAPR